MTDSTAVRGQSPELPLVGSAVEAKKVTNDANGNAIMRYVL